MNRVLIFSLMMTFFQSIALAEADKIMYEGEESNEASVEVTEDQAQKDALNAELYDDYAEMEFDGVDETEITDEDFAVEGEEAPQPMASKKPDKVKNKKDPEEGPVAKLDSSDKMNREPASVAPPIPAEAPIPTPKKVVKKKTKTKGGFFRAGKNCNMRSQPSSMAKKYITIKKGKKLWLDPHKSGWWVAYRKDGSKGYLSPKCF